MWYLNLCGGLFKRKAENKRVVKLTLKMDSGNKIGNEGVKALSEMLKVNTKFDYLRLHSNIDRKTP